MTWLQILSFAGIIGIFFGAGLAIAAYFNGKHIKTTASQTNEFIKQLHQDIVELRKDTKEL